MYEIRNIISMFGFCLNTQTKRHLVGGALLSISFLFGGLAITVMTLKDKDDKNDDPDDRPTKSNIEYVSGFEEVE